MMTFFLRRGFSWKFAFAAAYCLLMIVA